MNRMQRKAGFDGFAQNYATAHHYPFYKDFVEPTVLYNLGDVTGKSVLDLGCGDGYYTRMIKRMGANRVIGVDVSTEMIELAQHHEQSAPIGIEYLVSDVASLILCGQFDIVCIILVLPYAQDREHLLEMFRVAYDHLLPGGKLVAITLVQQPSRDAYEFKEFGFDISCTRLKNGDQFGMFHLYSSTDPDITIVNIGLHLFNIGIYEHCLKTVGFHQMKFMPITPLGEDPWKNICEANFLWVMVCFKRD